MKKLICSSCGQQKKASEFNRDKYQKSRGGLKYMCQLCEHKYRAILRSRRPRKRIRPKQAQPTPLPVAELETVVTYEYNANGDKFTANDVGRVGITIQVLMKGIDPDELSGIHIPKSLLPVFISVKFRKWLSGIVCQLEGRG